MYVPAFPQTSFPLIEGTGSNWIWWLILWSTGHVNNLYNTTFWAMVQKGGMSATAAEEELKGTLSSDKNEILFSRFGVNYNNEPDMYRKGSVVYRKYEVEDATMPPGLGAHSEIEEARPEQPGEGVKTEAPEIAVTSRTQADKIRKERAKAKVMVSHTDLIKDEFWERRPWILSGTPGRPVPKEYS